MTNRILLFLGLSLALAANWPARAALRIDVGQHVVPAGSNVWQIPVRVTGGDLVTDFSGLIQIGWDGGTLVGGQPGPVIRSIDYAGSIWAGATSGFDTFSTIRLTNQLLDPNVSLRAAGQRVAAQGLLFTLTLDFTGFTPGLFELRLTDVLGLSTAFQNAGTNVPVTIVNGLIAAGTTVPTASPRLGVGSLSGGRARLSFGSEMDRRYRVQWKLEATNAWTEAPLELIGTGGEIGWVDDGTVIGQTLPNAGRRFYRLRVAR